MIVEFDTHLFLEIILSVSGCTRIAADGKNSDIEYYTGPSGRKVAIWIADETIDVETMKGLLTELGLEQLIERLSF